MERCGLPWAYKAVLNLGDLHKPWIRGVSPLQRASTIMKPIDSRAPLPNLLLSIPSSNVRRAVWLIHRRDSVLGVVVSPRSTVLDCLPQGIASTHSKVDRIVRHLQSLPFQTTGDMRGSSPIVVHKNHLIGWCLDGAPATLYAHTIDELAKLKPARFKTLSPENAFVCGTYYEWDNWREVSMEPGWTWHVANEDIANSLVHGQVNLDQLQKVSLEVS
ncbi:uncharacterized protein TM35_000064940 [Trypanosoma theileri]|uniref:Uncharacterized protein n=1 Tax=Trypanosoma theileri TaxID=67003 RepID=A0A1X0P4K6_9TRYP|nr:uncharacterized protein TM35_000064940 [Trypanosoma theileri]ORC91489.1 hypothetical protein TM35_000064940 [Trypanosoma theileri]